MSSVENNTLLAGAVKAGRIGAIIEIMRGAWDLPADCNDGELFTYAEVLFDRIEAGDDREALDAYLADVQTGKLGMPSSEAYRDIADRSIALIKVSG
jgi:hypothetical protein